MSKKNHTVNESADKITIKAKLKRGTGTRDQDVLDLKVKGSDPDEVVSKLDATIANLEATSETLRAMQPGDSE